MTTQTIDTRPRSPEYAALERELAALVPCSPTIGAYALATLHTLHPTCNQDSIAALAALVPVLRAAPIHTDHLDRARERLVALAIRATGEDCWYREDMAASVGRESRVYRWRMMPYSAGWRGWPGKLALLRQMAEIVTVPA